MPTLGTSVASAYDPWAIQQRVGLTDARMALDSLAMPRTDLTYLDYRSGVMAAGDSQGVGGSTHMGMRVQPGEGMAVTVEMGHAIINTPGLGAYLAALDSQKTLPLAASSSTTNRIDLLVARVYDDLNPAIASAPGVRKFTVEAWTGDGTTGEPTVPVPTPTSGWTPLASVRVSKGVSEITTADITDLRGPGLVARGGMRGLYGEDAKPDSDAYVEPGAYPGDQRFVHGNAFPHQVFWGDNEDESVSGWRGVHNEIVYTGRPNPQGNIWVKGNGAIGEMCRVSIPDLGSPYVVYATGRANLTFSRATSAEVRISQDSATGSLINFQGGNTFGTTTDHPQAISVPPLIMGPFSGPKVISMNIFVRETYGSNYGVGYNSNATGQNVLSCTVRPATIDPQKIWTR